MVVDKSNGKGWFYLIAVHGNPPTHYYFASAEEAKTFCTEERNKGHEANLYDLKKGCAL